MNILVVSHEFPPIGGGGANACWFITKGYVEAGHKVTLITARYEGLQKYEILNGVEIFRVKCKRAHKEHCNLQEMFSYITRALPVASKLAKKEEYDICHVFFGIPSGLIGYWLKKRYKLPYIVRFGGGDIPGAQERFKYIYKMIAPVIRAIWKDANALIANSGGLREFAQKFYDKKAIDIVYNGVDTEKFYPNYDMRNAGQINLLFISRLIEGKGIQFIIPELKLIQSGTDKQVKLTVVGDGPYRERLVELTEQYGVVDMVTFVGQKDKEELLPYYQAGDIFVFPSIREGMPNAVLEAMACGLPVIMTPCGGSKELIEGNGVIVSAEEMGKTLQSIVMNVQQLECWGKESRKRAEQFFSWDRVVESYLGIMDRA